VLNITGRKISLKAFAGKKFNQLEKYALDSSVIRKFGGKIYRSRFYNYFVNKFGVNIVDETDKEFLIKAIETRNIITHNRGIRNKRYIQKVGENESEIGKVRDVGIEFSEKVNKLLYDSVKKLDSSLRKKLGVPGHRFDIADLFKKRA